MFKKIVMIFYLDESKVLKYFSKMRHNWMFFAEVVKITTTLVCKMPRSPDTLRLLLAEFTSVAWSADSKSMVLRLLDYA